MIKVAVCDDLKSILESMKEILENYFLQKGRKGKVWTFLSGEALLVDKEVFDIVFLDIEMPVMDGIETARRLQKKSLSTKIIYLTSYTNYKDSAFRVHAFDYLMKPSDKNGIFETMDEVLRYIDKDAQNCIISFNTEEGIVNFDVASICYFEFCNRKIKISTLEKVYFMRGGLKQLYDMIQQYSFGIPHKSYIVNFNHISNIKGYNIFLKNGEVIPLAQKKAVGFKEAFYDFLQSTYEMLKFS